MWNLQEIREIVEEIEEEEEEVLVDLDEGAEMEDVEILQGPKQIIGLWLKTFQAALLGRI